MSCACSSLRPMVERRAHEAAAVVDARDDVAGAIADRRDLVSAPIGMADRGEARPSPSPPRNRSRRASAGGRPGRAARPGQPGLLTKAWRKGAGRSSERRQQQAEQTVVDRAEPPRPAPTHFRFGRREAKGQSFCAFWVRFAKRAKAEPALAPSSSSLVAALQGWGTPGPRLASCPPTELSDASAGTRDGFGRPSPNSQLRSRTSSARRRAMACRSPE